MERRTFTWPRAATWTGRPPREGGEASRKMETKRSRFRQTEAMSARGRWWARCSKCAFGSEAKGTSTWAFFFPRIRRELATLTQSRVCGTRFDGCNDMLHVTYCNSQTADRIDLIIITPSQHIKDMGNTFALLQWWSSA